LVKPAAASISAVALRVPHERAAAKQNRWMPVLSLKRQIQLLAVGSVLLGLAFAAAALLAFQAAERRQTQVMLDDNARQIANRVDAELQRTIDMLRVLAQSNALQRNDYAGFHEVASRVVASDPHWENIQVISVSGEQLLNARVPYGTALPPLNRPDLPLKAVYTREPVISDLARGVVSNRLLTPVYVPVQRDGKVAYVIVAAIEPPNWQFLLNSRLPQGVEVALLDRFSFLVANTFDAAARGGALTTAALPRAPGQLSAGVPPDSDALMATERSALAQWTVVAFMPDARSPTVRLAWQLWCVAALVLLGAALLHARYVLRRLDASSAP
jgi:hypothetical protein